MPMSSIGNLRAIDSRLKHYSDPEAEIVRIQLNRTKSFSTAGQNFEHFQKLNQ